MMSDVPDPAKNLEQVATSGVPAHTVDSSTVATMNEGPEATEATDQPVTHNEIHSEQSEMEVSAPVDGSPSSEKLVNRVTSVTQEPAVPLAPGQDDASAGEASVTSMPAAMPPAVEEETLEPTEISEKDAATVASAPTIIVDGPGDPTVNHLQDTIASPHGNNAITERSPGGRYVRFMEKLGSGASKEVYRAYDTQEGIEVAWNVVHLAGVPKTERNRIVNEVRLLERLHHHNIISFHGSWVNRERQQVNFVTEILSSGTLQSFIKKVQVIRWKIAKRWARQILTGLEYLHAQDPPVIHRDLKCENIFINGTSGDLRIGDLGLSTASRNGRALSVLGTPEFMAPDMYEENAYDEKVDIYAFGMCLLEMFTKEIPYSECSNPAQIYKKVTRGDPPDSLRRLKSKHAREFIEYCLGTKDENGNYVRPSATELMAHPFLLDRPSDDDEVEVDPPMQERVIDEMAPTSSSSVRAVSATSSSPRTKIERQSSSAIDEDESDRFDEMPDSETSIRQPKVLVGRGQELKRDEKTLLQIHERSNSGGSAGEAAHSNPALPQQQMSQTAPPAPEQPAVAHNIVHESKSATQPANDTRHYLVAAAVIEDEIPTSKPYEDDTLKLVVTLPVDGQTQNVQFDFHLVQDDPIQVAKEMVSELDIPAEAVLEVSETISGLARAARVKQDKYNARTQQNQRGHVRSQSHGVVPQGISEMIHPAQGVGHPVMQQARNHQSMQDLSMQDFSQHIAQHDGQQHSLPSHEQGSQMHAHPPMQQMHMPHQSQVPEPHVIQPQQGWNPPMAAQGNGQMPVDPNTNPMPPPSFQHGTGVSNQATLVRGVSNPGPSEVAHSTPNYGQGQGQQHSLVPPPPPQQGNQVVQDAQNQGQAHYSHPPQSHMVHSHQVIQTGNTAINAHPAPAPFSHSPQNHPQLTPSATIQALSSQVPDGSLGGNYQAPSNERLGQAQFVQGSQNAQSQHPSSQSLPGVAPSQSHAIPTNQNLGAYALPVPQASQSTSALASDHQSRPGQQHVPQTTQQLEVGAGQPFQHAVGGNQAPNQMNAQIPAVARPQSSFPNPNATPPATEEDSRSTLNAPPPSRVGVQESVAVGSSSQLQQNATAGETISTDTHTNGAHGVPSIELYDPLDDELLAAELRKLDEDFKKNMMRAQKVFDTRMDNLQRSQVQREAQHLKTLEKHEKERADFEKRRQQEEIEQNRRIEQLQKDWAIRREAMRQKQMAEAQAEAQAEANATNASTDAI